MRTCAVLAMLMLATGCRHGRWVWQEELPVAAECRGGRINTEKRVTDVLVAGRTRNTVTRTDACLD